MSADSAAVERTLDAARLAVIKARACWAEWATAHCRAADQHGEAGSGDALWQQLQGIDQAASRAETELDEALAQLAGLTIPCPRCGSVKFRGTPLACDRCGLPRATTEARTEAGQ